jgi:ferrochelatase
MILAAGYDALLVVSFGGPERSEEVMPFLERVVRGRGVPRERLVEVAAHYEHFGGKSPINDRARELVLALERELGQRVYWGNRHAAPFLADTVREMKDAGVERALAFATSALPSYSSCRVYLEDIARARAEVGEGAPVIDKIPPFALHEGYVETCAARLGEKLSPDAHVIFTAHSIPVAMGDAYARDFALLAERVAERAGAARWSIAYQSRSGAPGVPWLEPDVLDRMAELERGSSVVVAPIGFVADHLEVVWDLDHVARERAAELGLSFSRAETANAHPRFVRMIGELARRAPVGCAVDCCPAPRRPT